MSRSVLVLGAGPAGAAAALFLARRGFDVTLIEAEQPEEAGEPTQRDSAPHRRQGHSFLAMATRILQEEAPEIVRSLIASGARQVPLAYVPGHWNLLARRALLDRALRLAVLHTLGKRASFGTVATGLLFDASSGNNPPRVFGVTTPVGSVTADVVIDAGGWRSPVRRWLAQNQIQLGVQNDPTSFFYVTRHYRLRTGAAFPSTCVPNVVMLDCISALAFPEDNGHFQLSVQFDIRDRLKRLWLDPVLFERGLAEIPAMAPWLDAGQPEGDPEPISSRGNRHSRLVLGRPLVSGLLLLGDAAVYTNPSAARGVAMALAHARGLADLLGDLPPSIDRGPALAVAWDEMTTRLASPWLESQIRVDQRRRRQVRAALAGTVDDGSEDLVDRFADAIALLRDAEFIGAAAERVFNMLMTPNELMRERGIVRRVLREGRAATSMHPRGGPTRAEFERLLRQA